MEKTIEDYRRLAASLQEEFGRKRFRFRVYVLTEVRALAAEYLGEEMPLYMTGEEYGDTILHILARLLKDAEASGVFDIQKA